MAAGTTLQAAFTRNQTRGESRVILRRLIANLRAQNWTAIRIELVIVTARLIGRLADRYVVRVVLATRIRDNAPGSLIVFEGTPDPSAR